MKNELRKLKNTDMDIEERIRLLEHEKKSLKKELFNLNKVCKNYSDQNYSLQQRVSFLLSISLWPKMDTMNDERKRDIIAEYWDKYTPEQLEQRLK